MPRNLQLVALVLTFVLPLFACGNSLHDAVFDNDVAKVRRLLADGADANVVDDDYTPLHRAALHDHREIAALLIQHGADVNAKDERGRTSLHVAADWGNGDFVSLLLRQGSNVNAKTNSGGTPLHDAGAPIARILIANGANVNAKTDTGWTPLHEAADDDNRVLASILINHGANVNAKDEYGKIPFDVAESKEMQRLFHRHGVGRRNDGFHCLTRWDGSHEDFRDYIKGRLNDPDSFEHVKTAVTPAANGRHHLYMTYRARNAFGGTVTREATGTYRNDNCDYTVLTME